MITCFFYNLKIFEEQIFATCNMKSKFIQNNSFHPLLYSLMLQKLQKRLILLINLHFCIFTYSRFELTSLLAQRFPKQAIFEVQGNCKSSCDGDSSILVLSKVHLLSLFLNVPYVGFKLWPKEESCIVQEFVLSVFQKSQVGGLYFWSYNPKYL